GGDPTMGRVIQKAVGILFLGLALSGCFISRKARRQNDAILAKEPIIGQTFTLKKQCFVFVEKKKLFASSYDSSDIKKAGTLDSGVSLTIKRIKWEGNIETEGPVIYAQINDGEFAGKEVDVTSLVESFRTPFEFDKEMVNRK